MTTEELAKMTRDQKRVRIAEACGWKREDGQEPCYGGTYKQAVWIAPNGVIFPTDHKRISDHGLPDYLFDLNAMAEADRYAAEHLMDGDQWEKYGRNLELIHPTACLMTGHEIDYYDLATLVTGLTASQRADAFLLTI